MRGGGGGGWWLGKPEPYLKSDTRKGGGALQRVRD